MLFVEGLELEFQPFEVSVLALAEGSLRSAVLCSTALESKSASCRNLAVWDEKGGGRGLTLLVTSWVPFSVSAELTVLAAAETGRSSLPKAAKSSKSMGAHVWFVG